MPVASVHRLTESADETIGPYEKVIPFNYALSVGRDALGAPRLWDGPKEASFPAWMRATCMQPLPRVVGHPIWN